MGREPDGRLRTGDWAADAALFLFAVIIGGLVLAGQWHSHGTAVNVLDLASATLACLGLWARNRVQIALLVQHATGWPEPG